ncbi:MAG TPA: DEAD/DEAH box helicase [Gemmatimonadales bacterium]|nr:DEAD/DEAH box helicase [Gemmatimonadales bacterium]
MALAPSSPATDTLAAYQARAAGILAASARHYLADVPGLGKTRTAAAAAALLPAGTPFRVLCPASAKARWEEDWALVGPAQMPEITSYDKVVRSPDSVSQGGVLILDEAHRLKERTAQRTKAVFGAAGLARKAERVWCLSGTPMPNGNPGELFTALAVLWPERLRALRIGSYDQFLSVFCHWAWFDRETGLPARPENSRFAFRLERRITGIKNEGRFKELLEGGGPFQQGIMTRRTWESEEVLAEMAAMPPILWRHEMVSGPTIAGGDDWGDLVEAGSAPPETAATKSLRHEVGLALAALAGRAILEELESDPTSTRVIFAYHKDVLGILEGMLSPLGVVRVDGSSTPAWRKEAVARFQDGAVRVFLGQNDACKESLTLTNASQVELIEPSFVPGDNVQMAHRIRRHGQTSEHLIARIWGLRDSYSGRIAAILARKARHLAQLEMSE